MKTYFDLLNKIKYFSVIYCDSNRLNDINQTYSEEVADMLIQNTYTAIFEILNSYFYNTDFSIPKFGGDEFLIIIDSCDREIISHYLNDIYILK